MAKGSKYFIGRNPDESPERWYIGCTRPVWVAELCRDQAGGIGWKGDNYRLEPVGDVSERELKLATKWVVSKIIQGHL